MARFQDAKYDDRSGSGEGVASQLRRQERNRRIFRVTIIAAILLILASLPVLFAGYILAKSGIVEVPVMSGWVYEPITPNRSVIPLAGSGADAVLESAFIRSEYNPNFGLLKVYLTEQELTTVLNSAIKEDKTGALPFPIRKAQAAVNEDSMEIFAVAERGDGTEVPVRAVFRPYVSNGRLMADTKSLTVGSLGVPDFIAKRIVQSLLDSLSSSLNQAAEAGGQLVSVDVSSGRIEMSFSADL